MKSPGEVACATLARFYPGRAGRYLGMAHYGANGIVPVLPLINISKSF
jgi:hypothetical protein